MTADPDYTIRYYRPGDEDAILATFNEVFREVCGEGYVDRRMDFWQWEFAQAPFGHRISLAFAPDGSCAGQYAGVVHPMATAFGDCTFVHIVDSMTHPDHRRGLKKPGLFVRVAEPWFELCHREGDAVLYGYPVPIAERIGQRYLEYHRLRVVDYLCRSTAGGGAGTAVPGDIDVRAVDSVPVDIDGLFARIAAEKACLTRREHGFLEWRYRAMPGEQRPGDPYELFTARRPDGGLAGFLILRPRHELVPGSCTIVDWMVPEADVETFDALLATATQHARLAGRSQVMAVFPDPSPEYRRLIERGFAVAPSREILERRLTHRIYHPQMTTEWLQEHWWYTLGDSDLV
jgi:hypothetical protein